MAARPVFPLSPVSPRCSGRLGKLGKAGWGTEVEKLVEAAYGRAECTLFAQAANLPDLFSMVTASARPSGKTTGPFK